MEDKLRGTRRQVEGPDRGPGATKLTPTPAPSIPNRGITVCAPSVTVRAQGSRASLSSFPCFSAQWGAARQQVSTDESGTIGRPSRSVDGERRPIRRGDLAGKPVRSRRSECAHRSARGLRRASISSRGIRANQAGDGREWDLNPRGSWQWLSRCARSPVPQRTWRAGSPEWRDHDGSVLRTPKLNEKR
jgi:hypothetical protein